MFSAAAIGLHNLPEGVASFAGGLEPSSSRLALPLAIALHNIPEGIAIAAPIYRATGSRARAFAITLAAALAEPLGAAFAWLALHEPAAVELKGTRQPIARSPARGDSSSTRACPRPT
ncbi:MAG: ZIP family metal transporter [Gammaproteobacteria bacterium]|nr:ZIP family metal transporter [Gammaproteobacteria bacterium]